MAPSNQQQANFQLRTNMDWEEIRRRLRSEYGSGVQSEAEISGVLADVDKDLEDCDAEFRRLQSGIIALQNQRKRLEEYKVSLRFLRSPIRRLPNETILRIFDYACEMNELTSKQLQTMPALAISGACSRWRDLARSCPELWSRIELEMWTIPRHLPGLPILDLYLDSSKQSPLTLEFPSINAELQAAHLEVCAKLAACSDRWKKLATGPYEIYQAMMAHNPSNFPLLEQLLVPNIAFNNEEELNCFQHASNLMVLSIYGIEHWENLQQRKFPWTQITELDVAQCEDGMKHIFEMYNLRELHFEQFSDHESTVKLCSPPITAPSVQKLALTLRPTSYTEPERLANVIFASLTCPALTSLCAEGIDGYKDPWPRDMVNGFISRSSFQLTTLSIKFIPLLDSNLIDLLRRLPSLHHLTVDDSNTSPRPVTSLLVQSLHAIPCTSSVTVFSVLVKRLQTLSLTTSAEAQEAFNNRDFVDMVSSRWFLDGYRSASDSNGGMACLRSVVMRFTNRVVDEEVYRPLKYLEGEGMRFVVIGQNS